MTQSSLVGVAVTENDKQRNSILELRSTIAPEAPKEVWLERSPYLLAVVAAALLMLGQLSAWMTVRKAMVLSARGEAEAALESVRQRLLARQDPPDREMMEQIFVELQGRGVRFLSLRGPIEYSFGAEQFPGTSLPGAVQFAGTRLRIVSTPLGPPRHHLRFGRGFPVGIEPPMGPPPVFDPATEPGFLPGGPPGPPPHFGGPPTIIVELESQTAGQLAKDALRSLLAGLLASTALVLLAWVLRKATKQRTLLQTQIEHNRRLAALGEMSAVVAHELKNPLAALKGHAQLLEESIAEGKPKEKAQRVVREAQRLEQLVNSLLAFVRTGEIRVGIVKIQEFLEQCARDANVPVRFELEQLPAVWHFDPERMAEVFENLFRNAWQAQQSSKVTTPLVVEGSVLSGGALRIRVLDHGPGIAKGEMETIFEPFRTNKSQGAGLGLAVARRIVKAHGGSITATNWEGGGAVFEVSLPAVKG